MWTLVFINLMFNPVQDANEPVIEAWYEFDTMEQCFIGREVLLDELGTGTDYFPKGTQAVCINNGGKA
jgi:hypothetical protein